MKRNVGSIKSCFYLSSLVFNYYQILALPYPFIFNIAEIKSDLGNHFVIIVEEPTGDQFPAQPLSVISDVKMPFLRTPVLSLDVTTMSNLWEEMQLFA